MDKGKTHKCKIKTAFSWQSHTYVGFKNGLDIFGGSVRWKKDGSRTSKEDGLEAAREANGGPRAIEPPKDGTSGHKRVKAGLEAPTEAARNGREGENGSNGHNARPEERGGYETLRHCVAGSSRRGGELSPHRSEGDGPSYKKSEEREVDKLRKEWDGKDEDDEEEEDDGAEDEEDGARTGDEVQGGEEEGCRLIILGSQRGAPSKVSAQINLLFLL